MPDLSDAVTERITRDEKQREAERRAYGFVPSDSMEQALRARARDPEAYDKALRQMGADLIPLSLYSRSRAAAIELGTFHPKEKPGA